MTEEEQEESRILGVRIATSETENVPTFVTFLHKAELNDGLPMSSTALKNMHLRISLFHLKSSVC